MKDYRSFERINIEDWEQDKQWLGNRLDFLWSIRDYNSDLYIKNKLNLEKNDFYSYNDAEVGRIAQERHYSVDTDRYDSIYKDISIEDQYEKYKELQYLRKTNLKEFLNKKNCNLYDYLLYKDIDGYFYDL